MPAPTFQIFGETAGPGAQVTDTANYSLGVEFYVTEADHVLTEIRFWASTTVTGSDHAVRLYRVDSAGSGTLLASATLPTPLQAGWNTATLASPVTLTADQRYRAAVYFTTDNGYTATGGYWTSGAGAAGIVNGPLVAPNASDATGNDQGSFADGGDGMPADSFGGGNYWVDVTVQAPSSAVEGAAAGSLGGVDGAAAGTRVAVGSAAAQLGGAQGAGVGVVAAQTYRRTVLVVGDRSAHRARYARRGQVFIAMPPVSEVVGQVTGTATGQLGGSSGVAVGLRSVRGVAAGVLGGVSGAAQVSPAQLLAGAGPVVALRVGDVPVLAVYRGATLIWSP